MDLPPKKAEGPGPVRHGWKGHYRCCRHLSLQVGDPLTFNTRPGTDDSGLGRKSCPPRRVGSRRDGTGTRPLVFSRGGPLYDDHSTVVDKVRTSPGPVPGRKTFVTKSLFYGPGRPTFTRGRFYPPCPTPQVRRGWGRGAWVLRSCRHRGARTRVRRHLVSTSATNDSQARRVPGDRGPTRGTRSRDGRSGTRPRGTRTP